MFDFKWDWSISVVAADVSKFQPYFLVDSSSDSGHRQSPPALRPAVQSLTGEWLKRSRWRCSEIQPTSSSAVVPSTTLMIVVFQRQSPPPPPPSHPPCRNITQHKAVLVTAVPATAITSLTGILPSEAAESLCCRPSARPSSPPRLCQTGPGELLLLKPGAPTVATHADICLLGNLSEDAKLSDESGRARRCSWFPQSSRALLLTCS